MKQILINGIVLWQFESLGQQAGLKHFISERASAPGLSEFTLSLSSLPDKERIYENRKLIADALRISDQCLYFPRQVHETRIVHVTNETQPSDLEDTDALITCQKGLCIAVMSADCVPILLFDRKNNAVGAVHSGWRGTVAKILEKTLNQMAATFGTKGENLMAGIGPSVSQDAYEVGEEVINEVHRAFGKEAALMIHHAPGKARLDLWRANQLQLLNFGVNKKNIEISNLCTVQNNHHFFSARKGDKGRFAAGIMLAENFS